MLCVYIISHSLLQEEVASSFQPPFQIYFYVIYTTCSCAWHVLWLVGLILMGFSLSGWRPNKVILIQATLELHSDAVLFYELVQSFISLSVFHLILSCDPSYTFCTLICVLDFHGLMKQDSDF